MKTCYGLYRGKVSNIEDPEKRGRIKVICPEVIGANVESAWCDPCVTVAYDDGGDFCIPAIDETVWIAFIAGDPNKPVYLGGWWKKESVPKETYDELDNFRIIKYSNNRIIMQEDYTLIEVEDKKTRATLTDESITLEVGELSSRVKMEDDNIVLEIGDSDTEIRIEDGEVYIKGNLHVDGEIYGTKSATLDEDVYAVNGNYSNNVSAQNNVSALNNMSAGNNIDATNNISASNDVSGKNVNATLSMFANNMTGNNIYVNGVDIGNHVHSVSTSEGTYTTSGPR